MAKRRIIALVLKRGVQVDRVFGDLRREMARTECFAPRSPYLKGDAWQGLNPNLTPYMVYFRSDTEAFTARCRVPNLHGETFEIDPNYPMRTIAGRRMLVETVLHRYRSDSFSREYKRIERVVGKLNVDTTAFADDVIPKVLEYVPLTISWRANCRINIHGWGTLRQSHPRVKRALARKMGTQAAA